MKRPTPPAIIGAWPGRGDPGLGQRPGMHSGGRGGGSAGSALLGDLRRDRAELLHEAEHVALAAMLDEHAVCEAIDVCEGNRDLLARWRDAHEVACVRAGEAPAVGHAIADLEGLLERVLSVGAP